MKKIFLLLAVVCLFSCSKENIPSINGTWTIVESNIGTGSGYTVQTYSPSSEVTIEFGQNGKLLLTGTNPGTAMSPLWEFDNYELKANHMIIFSQSSGAKEMEAFYTLDGHLFLNYTWARCGYEERFVRVK
jgi:hypothetical protein